MLRMYAVVREDLRMTTGKLAAQAGHAYLNAYLKALQTTPETAIEYQKDGLGTKICLNAPNELSLHLLKAILDDLNIPNDMIVDEGHVMPPMFDGSPVITALGFGPCTRDQVASFTKKFKLV